MKRTVWFFIIFLGNNCLGQNIGIGIATPTNKIHVLGNLLVNEPYAYTNALPTVAQTRTMVNGNILVFAGSDSTGRIYDPGGAAGDYNGNLYAEVILNFQSTLTGYELILDDVDLGTGDSLLVTIENNPVLSIGNGYTSLGRWIVNGPTSMFVTFKSNNDGVNGRGFNLRFRRLYEVSNTQQPITGHVGKSLFFDTKNGALRAGTTSASPIGQYSTGLGFYTTASGRASASIGSSNNASGSNSFAAGISNTASGNTSTSMGYGSRAEGGTSMALGTSTHASADNSIAVGTSTIASGPYSTAIGNLAIASGNKSISIGNGTAASGTSSTAMGNYVSTSGFNGAFALGDNSTTTVMQSFVANGFRSRFAGGYRLLTNSTASLGVVLLPDGGSWSAISDMRLKENFLAVDAEQILKKVASLPLTTWNYTAQNLKTSRHYGPMAQDFYKAFGHDELGKIGCDTLINQQDFLGVNLIAIQALEKRTSLQKKEIEDLKASNALLQQQIYMLMKKRK